MPQFRMQGDAFAWSLGLVSRILVRTIDEGSTLVMTLNSASCSENSGCAVLNVIYVSYMFCSGQKNDGRSSERERVCGEP